MSTTGPHPAPEMTVGHLVAVVGQWCDRTDPACLTGADAASAAEQVAVMVRRLSATQAALAARATDCHAFSRRFASGEAWLAGLNGTSQTQAKRALDTVKRLPECPAARAAFEAGELSVEEADLVTAAAVVNPAAEGRLVERAKMHVHADTRTAADRARHAVFSREQEQARLARMHRLRRVRELTDSDQLSWLDSHLVPDSWVMVRPVLDAYTDLEFQKARREGRREPLDAYRADALIAALTIAGTHLGLNPPPPSPPPDCNGGGHGGTGPGPGSAGGGTPAREPCASDFDSNLFTDQAERSERSRADSLIETTQSDRATDDGAGTPIKAEATVRSVEPLSSMPGPSPGRRRKPAEVVVLVDAIALRRGYATPAETCEIAGTGTPVSVDWIADRLPTAAVDVLVHDRIDIRAHTIVHRRRRPPGLDPNSDADPDLPADRRPTVVVLIDAPALVDPSRAGPRDRAAPIRLPGTDLRLSIERLRRLVPADVAAAVERGLTDIGTYRSATRHTPRPVRLAVLARDRCCTVPGCRRRQRLERDHVHDHALGGPATSRNLHGMCDPHHDDKTYRHARVVTTTTERLWYPAPADGDGTALSCDGGSSSARSTDPSDPSIPWRAPLGQHLNPWDLTDLPGRDAPDAGDRHSDDAAALPFS